jgi:hypothetical protein
MQLEIVKRGQAGKICMSCKKLKMVSWTKRVKILNSFCGKGVFS